MGRQLIVWGCTLDVTGLWWGPLAGCCDNGNEPSGSIRTCLEWLLAFKNHCFVDLFIDILISILTCKSPVLRHTRIGKLRWLMLMKLNHMSDVISSNVRLDPAVGWATVCFMLLRPHGQLRPQDRLSYSDIHHSSRLYPVDTSK